MKTKRSIRHKTKTTKQPEELKEPIEDEDIEIAIARYQFIAEVLNHSKGNVTYVGPLPDNVDFPEEKFPNLTGQDHLVEYHLFKLNDVNQLVLRWRLNK